MQVSDAITESEDIAEQQKRAATTQADQIAKAVHGAADEPSVYHKMADLSLITLPEIHLVRTASPGGTKMEHRHEIHLFPPNFIDAGAGEVPYAHAHQN